MSKILLDIDKAIKIVRETEEEAEVVPNLMIGFGIDKTQAEYVAEIKLRHLNREYILKRTQEIDQLKADIADMEEILQSPKKIRSIIINELKEVAQKYAKPRRTLVLYIDETRAEEEEEEIPDYPVHIFLTNQGYFKKVTPQSLRMSGEHKLKEDDEISVHIETVNNSELLFFTDRHQVYKCRVSDFEDTKVSLLGDFVPARLSFDENEKIIGMVNTADYKGYMLFVFENGKVAKVPLNAYQTKTNRRKLANAYSDKSPVAAMFSDAEEREYLITSSSQRRLLFNSAVISLKTTKNTQGVAVMTLKKNAFVESAVVFEESMLANPHRYRTKNIPAAGALPKAEDIGQQLTL